MQLFNVPDSIELSTLRELIPAEHLVDTYICGGFPAFCAGVTNKFRDIDLYFRNHEVYDQVKQILTHKTRKFRDGPFATTFRYQGLIIQCIFCMTGRVEGILSMSDLNVCQAAITYVDGEWVGQIEPTAFEQLALAHIENPIRTAARVSKYHYRMNRPRPRDYTGLIVQLFQKWNDLGEQERVSLLEDVSGFVNG